MTAKQVNQFLPDTGVISTETTVRRAIITLFIEVLDILISSRTALTSEEEFALLLGLSGQRCVNFRLLREIQLIV